MDAKGIARALRTQLKHLGLDITHAQALELTSRTAGLKDWNVLAAQEKPEARTAHGLFCPHCGKQGSVTTDCSAMVEQGPDDEVDGRPFTGSAAHYVCGACGGQFVNWASSWQEFAHVPGYLVLVGPEFGRWTASLVAANSACTVLKDYGWSEDTALGSSELPDILAELHALSKTPDAHRELLHHFRCYGMGLHEETRGDTLNEAVKKLLSRLSPEVDSQVLNRDVGI